MSPRVLVPAALTGLAADVLATPGPLAVVAAGKAAAAMHAAFADTVPGAVTASLAVGPHRPDDWAGGAWVTGGHPFATDGSVEAARRALEVARSVDPDGRLILLLSGGASALMAAPAHGLTLAVKQQTARTLMTSGADITALNAVRKHLSAVKGGRLAAACRGQVITLAISDVVGDDLSVIGSGPGVPDPSTWRDMREALHAFGGEAHDPAVLALAEAGDAGRLAETPKPGDAAMARSRAHVIGGRREAMAGARGRSAAAWLRDGAARTRPSSAKRAPPPRRGGRRWPRRWSPAAGGPRSCRAARPPCGCAARAAAAATRSSRWRWSSVWPRCAAPWWRRSAPTASTARPMPPARSPTRRRWPAPRASASTPRAPGSTATTVTRTSRSSAISGSRARPGPTSATCKCCSISPA